MKKILTLCIGLLFLASCSDKESDSEQKPEILIETAELTLDNQGKGMISCQVVPTDFDISDMKIYASEMHYTTNDLEWLGSSTIMSITKDPSKAGKWNLVVALSKGGQPYTLKPKCFYKLYDTTCLGVTAKDGVTLIKSKTFDLIADIKATEK